MNRLILQLLILAISGLIQWWNKPKTPLANQDTHNTKPQNNPPPTE